MVYSVEKIFEGATDVWMTKAVVEAIFEHDGGNPEDMDLDLGNIPKGLLRKIQYFSKAGFRNHEGGRGRPIKSEDNGVYRIGYDDLFRVYGFYSDESRKNEFIAIATCTKHDKKNSSRERAIIRHVAEVYENDSWKKA